MEELQDSAGTGELQRAVEDAERDIAQGRWAEHSEVLAKLARWSVDDPGSGTAAVTLPT